MNKIIFIAMFFISVSGCFIFSCYAEEAVALEDSGEENLLHESFDGRNWEVGWQKHDEQQSIIEYVLGGETVYNWSELVTVSIMIGLQETVTPEQFMENMKQNMKSSVQWNVLEKGDNDILYEWKVMGDPDLDDQHEIARITSTKEGMYSMRYTTKKVPISPDRREEWIKILGSGGFSADTQGSENEIFNKGMDYAEKGMYDEAITELTKVIQGNSRNVGAYYNRGVAYTMKGDTDRAISDYSKAIEIDPSDAELYYSRGLARAVKGDLDQAISDHNKAIQLNPKYAEAYAN